MLVLCPSAERQLATFTWCLVGWPAITSSPMMNSRTERWCSKTCNTKKKKISSTTNKGIQSLAKNVKYVEGKQEKIIKFFFFYNGFCYQFI